MLSQDGTKLYVATGSSPSETGGLYVYSLSSLNSGSSAYLESVMSPENSWYNTQLGSPQDDAFGHSMVETDTKLFVGARFASPGTSSSSYDSQQGSLYVYDKNNLSSSPLEITAPQGGNYNGALSNRFTWSMTKIGDKVYVSDRGDDAWMNNWDTNPNEGKSWVYAYDAENPSSPVSSFNDDQISGTASGFYHFSEIMHDASVEILGAQKSVVDVLNDLSNDVATAKSEAISTASADATSKADAAEASASADATTKADAAETSAKAYADQVVAATVDAAPAALDTLNELAAALGDDANFASTVTASIGANTSAIATLDAFVGEGNTEIPSVYSPSVWTSSSPITQNVTITAHPDGTQFASNSPYTGDTTWPTWIEEGQTGQSFIIRNLNGGGTVARMVLTGLEPSATYELNTFVQQVAGPLNHGHRIDVKWETADHPHEYQVNLLYSGTGEDYHQRTHSWPQPAGVTYAYVDFYFGVNGTAVAFDDFKIFQQGASIIALDTTAQTVAGAVNEVHAELDTLSQSQSGDTSSLTTAIATAKSEAISTASADATAKADAAEADAKAYADQVVAATVDAAPAALDTLNELAAALGDDANFASTVTTSIATKASQVDHDAEVARATAAEVANAAAIAAANSRTSGISTSSGSTDIQMTAELDMDSNNIKNANDVYAARGFIDHIESNDLKVQTGTVDFEGSIVNFGSSTITGGGFGNATKAEIDQHLNIPTANAGEFVKWTGTDYEWTDLVSGRLATDQLQIASGGSITATGPGGTFDFQDGIVMLSGSDVRVDTPTDVGQAANKGYVDGVVAATVDAAPAALDTLNELAAALGDDANFSATVATSIGTKASQTDHDAEVAARIAAVSSEASTRSSADAALQAEIDALEVLQSGDVSGLQSQITAEVARATSAEAVNAANIVSETSARSSADAALESDIIGLQNQVGTIIAGSPASLDTLVEIVSAFENADSDLSGVITANGGRLTTAENNITALETDLSAEESARGAGDAALQTQVTAHDGRLTTAEGEIDTLQSQMATRIGTDSDHSAALAVETAARIAGDNANSSEVSLEAATRSAADTQLTSDLSTEVARATQAEGQIASDLAQEVIDRQNADTGLQTQLDFIKENTDPASLDSLTEIVAAFQSADGSITGVVNSNTGRISALESGVVAIEAWNTDNVSEGSINKYWTEQRTKDCLSGGLCITYSSVTGEIKVDEVEAESSLRVAESVASDDADKLGGAAPSHYRIDVYDVNGTIVN